MNYFGLLENLFCLYNKLHGQTLTPKQLLRRIRKQVPYSECNIVLNQGLNLLPDQIWVAGLYDAELDADGSVPIEIEIAVHKIRKDFYFDETDVSLNTWAEFCLDFAAVLGHEFVHLHQFRRRQFKMCRPYISEHANPQKREQQIYYGDPDEIDAYAWTAAANAIIETRPRKQTIESTQLYKVYTRLFDKQDPVVVKFVSKANSYLKKLEKQKNDTTSKQN